MNYIPDICDNLSDESLSKNTYWPKSILFYLLFLHSVSQTLQICNTPVVNF